MSQCPWAVTFTNVFHISSPLPLDETGRLEGAGIGYIAFPPSAKALLKSFPSVNRSVLRSMLWALFQNCYLLSLLPETWGFCLYASARQLFGVPGGKTHESARFLMMRLWRVSQGHISISISINLSKLLFKCSYKFMALATFPLGKFILAVILCIQLSLQLSM